MLKYSHPTLALILDYWPITIFMPAILLLVATLALITRWWDRRDEVTRESVPAPVADVGVVGIWESGRRKPPTPTQHPLGNGHDTRAAS